MNAKSETLLPPTWVRTASWKPPDSLRSRPLWAPAAIAWGPGGITAIQLPESDEAATLARLGRRVPARVANRRRLPWAAATRRIAAFLARCCRRLRRSAADLAQVGAFERAVYRETRAIPAGATATYGAIAARIGDAGAPYDAALPRAVGQALGRNPWPIVIPCHRVTGADGKMGGFSAPGGRATKLNLRLELEGALAPEGLPYSAAADSLARRRMRWSIRIGRPAGDGQGKVNGAQADRLPRRDR